MSKTGLRLICDEKTGSMVLTLDFLSGGEGDLVCWIHREKDPSDTNRLWKFKDRLRIQI